MDVPRQVPHHSPEGASSDRAWIQVQASFKGVPLRASCVLPVVVKALCFVFNLSFGRSCPGWSAGQRMIPPYCPERDMRSGSFGRAFSVSAAVVDRRRPSSTEAVLVRACILPTLQDAARAILKSILQGRKTVAPVNATLGTSPSRPVSVFRGGIVP
jgi:hypothetical protein